MPEKNFMEKVEEYNNDKREKNPMDEVPKWKIYGVIGLFILVDIIAGMLILSGSPGEGLLVILIPAAGVLLLTQGGRDFLKYLKEEVDNKQQDQSDLEDVQVCPSCGLKNPDVNNYCHDCGEELNTEIQ
jgi:hypothetical protein